jgi:hypothetical protein
MCNSPPEICEISAAASTARRAVTESSAPTTTTLNMAHSSAQVPKDQGPTGAQNDSGSLRIVVTTDDPPDCAGPCGARIPLQNPRQGGMGCQTSLSSPSSSAGSFLNHFPLSARASREAATSRANRTSDNIVVAATERRRPSYRGDIVA